MRKYQVNQNFFKELKTEIQAYILGLLYSDGNVSINGNQYVLQFTQMEERQDLVYLIQQHISPTQPVYKRMIKINNKLSYTFRVNCKQLVTDLINLGCTPNKSLKLQFPDFIPDNLMPHFIRGLIDGDGCIWNGKRKRMIIKDKKYKSGHREKTIHNVKFTYTGNIQFVSKLQEYLINNLGFSKTKLNLYKPRYGETGQVCTLEYSGRKNIEKLYHYLYDNSMYYCKIKYDKFCEIINFNPVTYVDYETKENN